MESVRDYSETIAMVSLMLTHYLHNGSPEDVEYVMDLYEQNLPFSIKNGLVPKTAN